MLFPIPYYVLFVQLAAEHRWQVTCNEPVSRQASMNAMHACLSLPQAHNFTTVWMKPSTDNTYLSCKEARAAALPICARVTVLLRFCIEGR